MKNGFKSNAIAFWEFRVKSLPFSLRIFSRQKSIFKQNHSSKLIHNMYTIVIWWLMHFDVKHQNVHFFVSPHFSLLLIFCFVWSIFVQSKSKFNYIYAKTRLAPITSNTYTHTNDNKWWWLWMELANAWSKIDWAICLCIIPNEYLLCWNVGSLSCLFTSFSSPPPLVFSFSSGAV